jgi:hypothetical protein
MNRYIFVTFALDRAGFQSMSYGENDTAHAKVLA